VKIGQFKRRDEAAAMEVEILAIANGRAALPLTISIATNKAMTHRSIDQRGSIANASTAGKSAARIDPRNGTNLRR
jgi:hypothetical protein